MIQLITLERNWSTVGDNCRMSPVYSKDKKKKGHNIDVHLNNSTNIKVL